MMEGFVTIIKLDYSHSAVATEHASMEELNPELKTPRKEAPTKNIIEASEVSYVVQG